MLGLLHCDVYLCVYSYIKQQLLEVVMRMRRAQQARKERQLKTKGKNNKKCITQTS